MCGVWLLVGKKLTMVSPSMLLEKLIARGPEGSRLVDLSGVTLGFTRLAINGLTDAGMQPMNLGGTHWVCNGEIYNWKQLQADHGFTHLESHSDCEILGPLYSVLQNNLTSYFRSLDGVFALSIVDLSRNRVIVGRDPYGVRPLYQGLIYDADKKLVARMFASELKALNHICSDIHPVTPGSYYAYDLTTLRIVDHAIYHKPHWIVNPSYSPAHPNGLDNACGALRFALEEAVRKRLMTERPVAALLSGGIDSSLIASLVSRQLRELGKPPLKTFSIGMPGSTDLAYARQVAKWIGSEHTEVVMTPAQFFAAIPKVIYDIETYDTTSVRASVGNWLVSKEIKARCDAKVVFNGDGSDEIFGSYLYFYNAPTDRDFEEETERLLRDIHSFDVLRSDRCISSHGLEPRTPFLDKQFVAVAKQIATCWRRPSSGRCEKWILRRAFDDGVTLPREVLWRRKEAFSDGVSSTEKSWYQEIQERCDTLVDDDWKVRMLETPNIDHLPPKTKEQYYYRYLFHTCFGTDDVTVVPYFWMPKWTPGATDPSARTLAVYSS
jgi:asparagine synthase (glutamine-hydrolysing)